MDTSITNIIAHTYVVRNIATQKVYLINWSGKLIANYVDGKWDAATGDTTLDIDMYHLGNDTDMDYVQQWDLLA